MSSRGELFITEDVRDTFGERLDKKFGKDKWSLRVPDGWWDLWDERNFPETAEIEVEDVETCELIGRIEVKVKHYLEDNGYAKYIEVTPKSMKILTKKKELEV